MSATSQRLGWGQKIGYGSGDFAFNLYWQGISLYLFYFYTDVLGLPNAMAGIIYAIGSFWDAGTDPIMGYLADRTRTRWGRYRPYLLFVPIPMALGYIMLLWHPGDMSVTSLGIVALIGQLVFRLLFTMASTPYSALMARMTQNSEDRAGMAGARMLFAYLGAFSVVALAGGLLENADNDSDAFMSLAIISGLLATVIFWICFAICREPPESDAEDLRPTIKQTFASLKQNTPFLIVFAAVILMTTGVTVIGKTIIYFFEYQMGDRNGAQIALMAFGLTGLLVIPFWTFVTLKTSKRFVWMVGSFFLSLALIAFLFNPAETQNTVILNYIAISFGAGAFAITFWGMLPDTVEYGEWKTGYRVESMVFGFATFAQKSAVALSALILGVLLDVIGYQAGVEQSEATLSGLRMIIVFVPLAGVVASVACIYFYPLSPQRHAGIVAELKAQTQ
ncbi:MAG: putative symporter YjmB [Alphaproteobacteria bacterium]|nr:MAG: putative symporter YjmB [Alphaproteobacteria bacterium]